jgi:hypothetical protein
MYAIEGDYGLCLVLLQANTVSAPSFPVALQPCSPLLVTIRSAMRRFSLSSSCAVCLFRSKLPIQTTASSPATCTSQISLRFVPLLIEPADRLSDPS